jgi:hypothetical protein
MTFLEEIFSLLKRNKLLPNYSAERRIDIFINFYLEEILNHFLGSDSIKFILPEFPLKKENNNQFTQIDYVCFDTKKRIIYFVELKTDENSVKPLQYATYNSYTNWSRCFNEFKTIKEVPHRKKIYIEKYKKANEILETNGLCGIDCPIKIVYISPIKFPAPNISIITFEQLMHFTPNKYQDEWKLLSDYFFKSN